MGFRANVGLLSWSTMSNSAIFKAHEQRGAPMILKQIRISRNLSQEQLAQMSGLNVRTIQRIESGQNASLESLKCLAAVFEVDVSTLKQEKFMIDKSSDHWRNLPFHLRCFFWFNLMLEQPARQSARRVLIASHISGYLSCLAGLYSPAGLVGGLLMLANAYLFHLVLWQGDKYGIWYDGDVEGAAAAH
jgi:transcriptional regulator with XRE-family HTH domain